MRDSFVFFRSFYDACMNLPDDMALDVFKAICNYALNGEEPEPNTTAYAFFLLMKPNIDSNNKRYETNKENGLKGGRPKKNYEEPKSNPKETEMKPKRNRNETEMKPKRNRKETEIKPNGNLDVDVDVDVDVNADVDVDENTRKEKGTNVPEKKSTDLLYFESEEVQELFLSFLDNRRQNRVKNSQQAVKLLVKELNKVDDTEKIKMLETSIMNNWRGVFAPKNKSPSKEDPIDLIMQA